MTKALYATSSRSSSMVVFEMRAEGSSLGNLQAGEGTRM